MPVKDAFKILLLYNQHKLHALLDKKSSEFQILSDIKIPDFQSFTVLFKINKFNNKKCSFHILTECFSTLD